MIEIARNKVNFFNNKIFFRFESYKTLLSFKKKIINIQKEQNEKNNF